MRDPRPDTPENRVHQPLTDTDATAVDTSPASATEETYSYLAFGLSVRSDIVIPEFVAHAAADDAPVDVTIRYGVVNHPESTLNDHRGIHADSRGEIYLPLEVGDVLVRGGSEVIVEPASDVDEELLRWYLVGSVFNHLLYQRGSLVLHASTVTIGSKAVCFLGQSCAGKSTTALALFAAGYPVVADDVAAVTFDGDTALVQPGFPALKLDAPSRSALTAPLEPLPAPSPTLDRHFYRVPGPHTTAPLPLARIYSLAEGPETEIHPLEPGEALMMLVRDTYTNLELEGIDSAMANLVQCGRVVRSVPVKRLVRKYGRDELTGVVDAVVDDLIAG